VRKSQVVYQITFQMSSIIDVLLTC